MARSLNTQILVVGRQFPILPFERALAAAGIPDYLCVDTLAAAEMLSADGFDPDIVIADAGLLAQRRPTAWRTAGAANWIAIENDIDDFEDVLREELTAALRARSAAPIQVPTHLPVAARPVASHAARLLPTGDLHFG